MLREMVGKVVRSTPGLRRIRNLVRGGADAPKAAANGAEPQGGVRFGAESPTATPPASKPTPPASKPTPPAAQAAPPAAQAAPPVSQPAPPDADAPGPKTAAPAKAAGKKAAGKKAAEKATDKPAEKVAAPAEKVAAPAEAGHKKDEAEIEALRAEAERKKAEIRARKEAEAKAAQASKAAAPAASGVGASGIAAMIAQTGGKVDEVGAKTGVTATSGIKWVAEDKDIHLADDGTEFWGAIDNESSRAFARGDTLIIDQWECINCGTCVENTEHVFVLPNDSKAVVVSQEGPMDLIQDAIDACPVTCIHWTDNPGQFEQINDAEGNPLH